MKLLFLLFLFSLASSAPMPIGKSVLDGRSRMIYSQSFSYQSDSVLSTLIYTKAGDSASTAETLFKQGTWGQIVQTMVSLTGKIHEYTDYEYNSSRQMSLVKHYTADSNLAYLDTLIYNSSGELTKTERRMGGQLISYTTNQFYQGLPFLEYSFEKKSTKWTETRAAVYSYTGTRLDQIRTHFIGDSALYPREISFYQYVGPILHTIIRYLDNGTTRLLRDSLIIVRNKNGLLLEERLYHEGGELIESSIYLYDSTVKTKKLEIANASVRYRAGSLILKSNGRVPLSVYLFRADGKLVKKFFPPSQQRAYIPLREHMAPGIYIASVRMGQKYFTLKFSLF